MIKKTLQLLLALIISIVSFSQETFKFSVPAGLPELTIVKMEKMDQPVNYKIDYHIEKNSSALVNSILKGEPDFVIAPSNLAERVSDKNLPYYVAGVAGWGSFYLIGNKKVSNLRGISDQGVFINGKGLTPDLVTQEIFKSKKIDNVKMNYLPSPSEVALMFLGGKADFVVVPEPMLSEILEKKPNTEILMNLNEEWKKELKDEYGYPQSILLVKKSIYDENRKSANEIIEMYKESINYLNNNFQDPLYSEKKLSKENISRLNLKFVSGKSAESSFKKFIEKIGENKFDEKIYR